MSEQGHEMAGHMNKTLTTILHCLLLPITLPMVLLYLWIDRIKADREARREYESSTAIDATWDATHGAECASGYKKILPSH
jgi:uncharacterized membrane protein YsdA (DUF1294 family)